MTTPDAVEKIVNNSPYIKEGISRNIINYSSLARDIKSEVEDLVFRDVSLASIITALQRLAERINYTERKDFRKFIGNINVRSGISELTFSNSNTLIEVTDNLTQIFIDNKSYFCYIKGSLETSFIFESNLTASVKKVSSTEQLICEYGNLSGLSIQLGNGHMKVPGVIAHILHLLAWRGINLIEVVSTTDELTIILKENEINEAFSIVHNYKIGDRK